MKKTDENLAEWLRRFVNQEAADAMAGDIQAGDAMLSRFSSPVLSQEAAVRISGRLCAAVAARRYRRRVYVGFAGAAVAAMTVLMVYFGTVEPAPLPQSRPAASATAVVPVPDTSAMTPAIWTAASDEIYAHIRDELDNIAASIEEERVEPDQQDDERPVDAWQTNLWDT